MNDVQAAWLLIIVTAFALTWGSLLYIGDAEPLPSERR